MSIRMEDTDPLIVAIKDCDAKGLKAAAQRMGELRDRIEQGEFAYHLIFAISDDRWAQITTSIVRNTWDGNLIEQETSGRVIEDTEARGGGHTYNELKLLNKLVIPKDTGDSKSSIIEKVEEIEEIEEIEPIGGLPPLTGDTSLIGDSDLVDKSLPFLSWYSIITLSGLPREGKTTLVYTILSRLLGMHTRLRIVLLSEVFVSAKKHLKGAFSEDTQSRAAVQPASKADKKWLGNVFTKMLEDDKDKEYILVLDSLKPVLATWNVGLNDNDGVTSFMSFFKKVLIKFKEKGIKLLVLNLHHLGRPDKEGNVAKGAMGAQAITSQSNTTITLTTDKHALLTTLEWESQVIDSGGMRFKLADPKQVDERTVYTTYQVVEYDNQHKERSIDRKELELCSDAAATIILNIYGELEGKAHQQLLIRTWGGNPSKWKKVETNLIDGDIIKPRYGHAEYRLTDRVVFFGNTAEERIAGIRAEYGLPLATYKVISGGKLEKEMRK